VIASTLSSLASYREGKPLNSADPHAASCFSNTILSLSFQMTAPKGELLIDTPSR
jgi:hypothetical protein